MASISIGWEKVVDGEVGMADTCDTFVEGRGTDASGVTIGSAFVDGTAGLALRGGTVEVAIGIFKVMHATTETIAPRDDDGSSSTSNPPGTM
jgi:hypothetical protein